MKGVDLYGRVRYAVQIDGISRREAARRFGIDPRTVAKMLTFSVPPGYRRHGPPKRPRAHRHAGRNRGVGRWYVFLRPGGPRASVSVEQKGDDHDDD